MSDIIHLLPDNIANQIAAGEVIQRPASVVKELVENSIDAGASCIQINIKDAGRTLIQVIDDGKGMSETDARMAFERHATSKISSADDLFALRTMGFRGEALASIVAVAHVELRTRTKDLDVGVKLTIAGSVLSGIEEDVCAVGSVFSVKNLFFNVPARRKFLKSNETEFRNIVNELERIALVNPHTAFSLFHNDVEIINLPEAGMRQRILDVYGKALNPKLLPVEVQSNLITISGFVGKPDSVKKRGALQYFFVNGRFMKHPYFHKAVMQAYENIIPVGEMPNYFIYFTLDPETIDVNIHPTKTEIKFENEQPIWQILVAAVREALAKASMIPTIDFDRQDAIDIPVYTPSSSNATITPPTVRVNADYNPFDLSSGRSERKEFDWSKLYQDFENSKTALDHDLFDETHADVAGNEEPVVSGSVNQSKELFPCYQYKDKYIITALKSGLALIDQHRAHLNVLYEQYANNIKQRRSISQKILFPEIVELSSSEALILPDLLDDLSYVGFELSDLGNNTYVINGLPSELESVDPVSLLKDMISKAMEHNNSIKEDLAHILALTLAKATAIKYGKTMSVEEMEHLIASLFSCRETRLTPDGKNILTLINDDELERRFR
ncbi:DNA mismatch repair endonuclease MutL [Massilibacteroides vaginae]|uniref:DNA mismatch repair endonuclease MutL n=1 Tax=Massilibacteroides vaginae TaxID=1673718 RepID=UPI000A1CEAED|nr:DNA mismatch repair endonuclease MutL [Massilibacteroides vaginae]